MIDLRDPEAPRHREMARLLLDANWRDGLIGDAAYLRSLMNLGCTEREARVELSLLNMARAERRVPCAETTRMDASREWIKNRRG